MDGPRPSAVVAPSIWYAEVATPKWNPVGNTMPAEVISGAGSGALDRVAVTAGWNVTSCTDIR
jgi:hypothetical protein